MFCDVTLVYVQLYRSSEKTGVVRAGVIQPIEAWEEVREFWNVGGCSRLKMRIGTFEFHAMQEFGMSLQRPAHRTNGLKMAAVI